MVDWRRRKCLNNREQSLHAILRRDQHHQRLTQRRSWGRDRLHEKAAGEDVATAAGDGGGVAAASVFQELNPTG